MNIYIYDDKNQKYQSVKVEIDAKDNDVMWCWNINIISYGSNRDEALQNLAIAVKGLIEQLQNAMPLDEIYSQEGW